jgi:hypothetical protein
MNNQNPTSSKQILHNFLGHFHNFAVEIFPALAHHEDSLDRSPRPHFVRFIRFLGSYSWLQKDRAARNGRIGC